MSHTLLLADDSLAIQRVVELTFAGEDIRVVAVGDGQQAIERLTADRPDIVLADIAMPLADGYAVAEFVRSTPAIADVPVLLLAGAFDIIEDSRLGASGAMGVLVKPFEPHVVINRVRELLGLGPATEAPATGGTRLFTPAVPPREPRTLSTTDAPFWIEPSAGVGTDSGTDSDAPPRVVEPISEASTPVAPTVAPPMPSPPPIGVWARTPPSTAAPWSVINVAPPVTTPTVAAAPLGAPAAPLVLAEPMPILDEQVLSGLVDRIAARVVEQLSERLRDEVTSVVLDVSERLVREEIVRIRDAARAQE